MAAIAPGLAKARPVHFLRVVEQHETVQFRQHGARCGFVRGLDVALSGVGFLGVRADNNSEISYGAASKCGLQMACGCKPCVQIFLEKYEFVAKFDFERVSESVVPPAAVSLRIAHALKSDRTIYETCRHFRRNSERYFWVH